MMSVPIAPISSPVAVGDIASLMKPGAAASAPDAFGAILSSAMNHVDGLREKSRQSIENVLSGEGELYTAALDVQKAQMAMDMFTTVRNKVVSAYQEVMRMQL
jgi:flagellar hook-basal body complex protein FliE